MCGTSTYVSIGGGGEGAGWRIDGTLLNGVSNRSQTFENRCLASAENFTCINLEVWSLGQPKRRSGRSDSFPTAPQDRRATVV